MFLRRIVKRLRVCFRRSQKESAPGQQPEKAGLSKNLQHNIDHVWRTLGHSGDVKLHTFAFRQGGEAQGAIFYIDGLVNVQTITDTILRPLKSYRPASDGAPLTMDALRRSVLCSCDVAESNALDDLISGCLSGDTALMLDGCARGLILSTRGWDMRSVTEPQSESVVRGPREGFTENFRTNTALLRRRIKSAQFRLDHMIIGRRTQTNVCVAYIDGVANQQVVVAVKERLAALDIDSILDTGYIEQYIEDAPFSLFPTIGYSEKPDVVAGRVLEGRVAIIADGSPFVLTAPMLFVESFQTSEDYYTRPIYASAIRLLRFAAFFLCVFAPAIYIALTTFHQELIPTTLLYTIADAREGTPFPSVIEASIMVFAYEILREAGIRLPRPVGQAISIVGALVMGDAAVSAGLVGAPMVITIAITAVASFVVPEQVEAAALLRIVAMLFAAFLGGFGIAMVFLAVLIHLAALRSFGIPYFGSVAPGSSIQDSFVRLPLWKMDQRPRNIAHGDITRRRGVKPPPDGQRGGAS